jgi:phosphoglycerol transferase MdoB-like AlkP superfamily enzyme
VFSILPLQINHSKKYQGFLFYLYFILNLLGYATNFVDFIYYRFNFGRSTIAALDSLKHESNKLLLLTNFLLNYWHVFVLFFLVSYIWIYLYKKVALKQEQSHRGLAYFGTSAVGFLVIATLIIGGIRGDFKKSTRPINLVDANRFVKKSQQADLVLNSTFSFLRTLGVQSFKKTDFNIPESVVNANFQPIKLYDSNAPTTPNIVLIITESMGREYIGAFNKNTKIKDYVSYTPFIDSLATESLIFTNAYANGYKSIHGMSSILSGIPSFKDAFTSSPFAKQNIGSMVSCLKSKGYDTSFFHGAPNGSMGFLGFGNILGFDHYYGMTEYGNDADFDGSWGIWDVPFMQFMNKTISQKKAPFFSTIFTVTSHEPYVVPAEFKNKLPKGTNPMHQPVGYTDYAFKKFFEAAKKQPWFENTIFIITADHCNLVNYYEEYYHKIMNRLAVPILFYSPKHKLKGESNELAQHIDIFPTVMDIIGYNKPFRSWGRSLMDKKQGIQPFVINYNTGMYNFARGNYVCAFDGKVAVGFYSKEDKEQLHNLIGKRNKEMNDMERACKGFLQDYFNRIIDKNLKYQ